MGRDKVGHFAELDGYRGLAALAVVLYHAYQDPRVVLGHDYTDERWWFVFGIGRLNIAVTWFFVLSGFLIFLPFARAALDDLPTPTVESFLARRARRILPLYLVAFVLVWLLRFGGSLLDWRDLLAHLTFTHIFFDDLMMRTLPAAWSLADEVIYYIALALCAPPLVRWCRHVASRRWRAVLLIGGVAILIRLSLWYQFWVADSPSAQSGPVAQFAPFGCGMLLAILSAWLGQPLGARAAWWMRWVALPLVVGSWMLPNLGWYLPGIAGGAFALLLATTVLASGTSLWKRALATTPLRVLGVLSYGVYLWHQPIEFALYERGLLLLGAYGSYGRDLTILLALTLPLAAITYVLIERPALRARPVARRSGPIPIAQESTSRAGLV